MEVNLLLMKKDGRAKAIPMPSSVTVIGRRRDCDLRVPLATVSRRHCQLSKQNGMLKIRDLGSRNGTIVNGQIVEEAQIKAGDEVKIGSLTFKMQINGKPDLSKPTQPNKRKPAGPEPDELFADFSDIELDGDLEEDLVDKK